MLQNRDIAGSIRRVRTTILVRACFIFIPAFILVDWIPMFIGIQGRRVRRISYFIQIVRKNEA